MASINKLTLEKGQESFVRKKEIGKKKLCSYFFPLTCQNKSEKS